jgi:hypothetical protein
MNILLSLFLISTCFAHEEEGGGPSIGKGKGIEAYSEHDGFQLSKQAIKRFGIETKALSLACDLKGVQIVSALDHKEIFILRGTNFKSFNPKCSEVKPGDLGVTKGAEFLRVVEMDLVSGEEGHHDDDEIGKTDSRKTKEAEHD